jgi:hypothetical protein
LKKEGGNAVMDYLQSSGLENVILTPTAEEKLNRWGKNDKFHSISFEHYEFSWNRHFPKAVAPG